MLWNGRWRVMPNAVPYSNRSLPFGARLNGLMAEVLESHIRETFDRNDCYSREVSQSVDDTIELVRAYLK